MKSAVLMKTNTCFRTVRLPILAWKKFQDSFKKNSSFIVSNCQAGYIEVFLEDTGLAPYVKDHLPLGIQTKQSRKYPLRL